CNNFTSEIDKWMNLFLELFDYFGKEIAKEEMFPLLFWKAMESDRDLGGMVSCNYHSGEPITGFEDGRPLLATRSEEHTSELQSRFDLVCRLLLEQTNL